MTVSSLDQNTKVLTFSAVILSIPWSARVLGTINSIMQCDPDEIILVTDKEVLPDDIKTVVRHVRFHGNASESKNAGLAAVLSTYAMIVDDDLTFSSDHLLKARQFLTKQPEVQIAGGRILLTTSSFWTKFQFVRKGLFTEYMPNISTSRVPKVWEPGMIIHMESARARGALFNERHGAGAVRVGEASAYCSHFDEVWFHPELTVFHNVEKSKTSFINVFKGLWVRSVARGHERLGLFERFDSTIYRVSIYDLPWLFLYSFGYILGRIAAYSKH